VRMRVSPFLTYATPHPMVQVTLLQRGHDLHVCSLPFFLRMFRPLSLCILRRFFLSVFVSAFFRRNCSISLPGFFRRPSNHSAFLYILRIASPVNSAASLRHFFARTPSFLFLFPSRPYGRQPHSFLLSLDFFLGGALPHFPPKLPGHRSGLRHFTLFFLLTSDEGFFPSFLWFSVPRYDAVAPFSCFFFHVDHSAAPPTHFLLISC